MKIRSGKEYKERMNRKTHVNFQPFKEVYSHTVMGGYLETSGEIDTIKADGVIISLNTNGTDVEIDFTKGDLERLLEYIKEDYFSA